MSTETVLPNTGGAVARGVVRAVAPRPTASAPGIPAPIVERSVATATGTQRLNARVLDAFRLLAAAEARIVVFEARLLERLATIRGHIALGFAQFPDCARETLGVSPRYAEDRRLLFRLFRSRPNVEEAFLEGRVTPCQALALRSVLNDENETMWLEQCRRLTVAELKRRVRDVASATPPDDDEPFETISFTAPPAVAVAFDQAMETARRVLGVNAPRYRCLEAILAEAAPEAAPAPALDRVDEAISMERRTDERGGIPRLNVVTGQTVDTSRLSFFTLRPRAWITLDRIDRELDDIDDLIETDDPKDPAAIVARLKSLQTAARPLRYLTGRLLGDLRDTGRLSLAEFTERHLRVSERTARNLLHETILFENPTIAAAYGSGRIGIGQAVTIGRLAASDRLGAWIERAERVTHRQFQREAAIFERLQDYFPTIAARHAGPMPEPGLETRLFRELMDRGWTEPEIQEELRRAGLDPHPADVCQRGPDPAEDSSFMRRAEILVEWLIVTAFDTVPTPQTFANAALPMKTIRVRAPESIARWWRAAIGAIQRERPGLPVWAGATLLIRDALEWWEVGAARARPAGKAILERDGYLCQAPGCTRRRDLQVHHIRFRSHGGDNRPENRITLCFVHHQILLHEMGTLAVRGVAPHGLRWRLGRSVLRGERYETK